MKRLRRLPVVGLLLLARPSSADFAHAGLRENVGPPRAAHAMPGVDAERTRRTHTSLGPTPRVEARLRLAYGVGRGLVTHDDGSFFVLHPSARASRFDAQGKLLYSLRLLAEPMSAPVTTSNGASAFVASGQLYQVDDAGRVISQTALGDADFGARSILATRDGSVLVASSGLLVKVGAFGDVVWRKSIPETPLELLETSAGLLCVSAPGSVFRLDGAGRLSKLGELGGTVGSLTSGRAGRELLARTGNHRLVNFDLVEHRLRGAIEDTTLDFDGPVLLGQDQQAQAFTSDGLLVRYRSDGSEAQRLPIDPGARRAPGNDDALLLTDGRLLVARAGADVVVVSQGGEVTTIANSSCPDPIGIFGAGPRAALVACRSGNMLRVE